MWWGLLVAVASLPDCPNTPGPIVIPDGTSEIPVQQYYDCDKLTGVTFNTDGVLKEIGFEAFVRTSITGTLTIPASVTKIWTRAFYNDFGINGNFNTGPTQIVFNTTGGPSQLQSIDVSFDVFYLVLIYHFYLLLLYTL